MLPLQIPLEKIDSFRWRIPRQGAMRVDGLVFASEHLMDTIRNDQALQQVANVACLPGIVGHSLAMPDIHWGYGFPIGGVAAFDEEEGVVSPGGVGYDINCGVRLLATKVHREELQKDLIRLADALFINIPSGVGSHRKDFKLSVAETKKVLKDGAGWAVKRGFGRKEDLNHLEENGCLEMADPDLVSERALERGRGQLGTVGSGNHFVEVQYVAEIFQPEIAARLGLFPGQIVVTVHSGSRGLGYQVCDDFLKKMLRASEKYGITLPDRQLCCAPLKSPEGKEYLGAMAAAANFAFANRQMMAHWVRETFEEVLGRGADALGVRVIYDVCHNIAKFETHLVNGKPQRLCVHRKGATRALPPKHPLTPAAYKDIGQPVLVPGDMGRYSFVLVGAEGALTETFGSSCHGAGRVMSRTKAKEYGRKHHVEEALAKQGIIIRAAGRGTILEEIPEAYKDAHEVVDVADGAGISKKVAMLRPLAVVKG